MHVSAASPGIPGEPTRLLGDLQQNLPRRQGHSSAFAFLAKLPGDLPTGYAIVFCCHEVQR